MTSTYPASEVLLTHYADIATKQPKILEALNQCGTPLYIGDREIVVERYTSINRCLCQHWPQHRIAYSFKTNYLVAQSATLRELGIAAEVVSGFEYRLAKGLGYRGDEIVFNGPCKTDDDLRDAMTNGVVLNVNDLRELKRANELAAAGRFTADIGIRLSASLGALGHSRFGLSIEYGEAHEAVALIDRSPHLRLSGIHAHLKGDTDDPALYFLASQRFGDFLRETVPACGKKLRYIDVGGGFPAHTPKPHSRSSWNPQPIECYVQTLAEGWSRYFPDWEQRPTLICEPGRYLVSDAVLYVCRVLHVQLRGQTWLVNTNGTMCMVPYVHYGSQTVRAYTADLEPRSGSHCSTIVHGATCQENDILYQGSFPAVQPDDLLVFFGAGAYNSTLAPTFIFEPAGLAWI